LGEVTEPGVAASGLKVGLFRQESPKRKNGAAGSSNKPAAPITYEVRGRGYLARGSLMCDRLRDF
jgi:hypothetical protein